MNTVKEYTSALHYYNTKYKSLSINALCNRRIIISHHRVACGSVSMNIKSVYCDIKPPMTLLLKEIWKKPIRFWIFFFFFRFLDFYAILTALLILPKVVLMPTTMWNLAKLNYIFLSVQTFLNVQIFS